MLDFNSLRFTSSALINKGKAAAIKGEHVVWTGALNELWLAPSGSIIAISPDDYQTLWSVLGDNGLCSTSTAQQRKKRSQAKP